MILKKGKLHKFADLFCGAGGTTTGAVEAVRRMGYAVKVTALNHNKVAVATHATNHPDAIHLCASIDSTNPRDHYEEGELDGLLASPECMNHCNARGSRPINDQSRSTAWCVLRWLDALRPPFALIENVFEMTRWGPIGANGRPLKSREGEIFEAWLNAIRALGYKVDYRKLCAADYGDPTTRTRLFVQAVRGRLKITWPHATHAPAGSPTLFSIRNWVPAWKIIDWTRKGTSIFERERPLADNSIDRINEGLQMFSGLPFLLPKQMKRTELSKPIPVTGPVNTVLTDGRIHLIEPFLIAMEHGGRVLRGSNPMPTVTTAKGGAFSIVEPFLIQLNHGNKGDARNNSYRIRRITDTFPTVCGNRGEWALIQPKPFIVKYNGTGGALDVDDPIDSVTTRDRFGLVQPTYEIRGKFYKLDVLYRMLFPEELAAAQGFPRAYRFTGTKTQVTKQIGNAVPRRLARALVAAIVSQNPDVAHLVDDELEEMAVPA